MAHGSTQTVTEYARRQGIPASTVYRWLQQGLVPAGVASVHKETGKPEGLKIRRWVLVMETKE